VQSRDVTERVIFEIWTNGTLTPREGLHKAAVELIRIFSLFQINTRPAQLLPRVKRPPSLNLPVPKTNEMSENNVIFQTLQLVYEPNQFLAIDIGILPLNSKQLIRLKEKNIHRVGDLFNISYTEMLDLPEMTEDSLFTLLCHLRTYGLQLRSALQCV
jgi:DNA-directed RNA polymerase alpha subunit